MLLPIISYYSNHHLIGQSLQVGFELSDFSNWQLPENAR